MRIYSQSQEPVNPKSGKISTFYALSKDYCFVDKSGIGSNFGTFCDFRGFRHCVDERFQPENRRAVLVAPAEELTEHHFAQLESCPHGPWQWHGIQYIPPRQLISKDEEDHPEASV